MIVPQSGHRITFKISPSNVLGDFGSVGFIFDGANVDMKFANDLGGIRIQTGDGAFLQHGKDEVLILEVTADGMAYLLPRNPSSATVKLPPFNNAPRTTPNFRWIRLQLVWNDVNRQIELGFATGVSFEQVHDVTVSTEEPEKPETTTTTSITDENDENREAAGTSTPIFSKISNANGQVFYSQIWFIVLMTIVATVIFLAFVLAVIVTIRFCYRRRLKSRRVTTTTTTTPPPVQVAQNESNFYQFENPKDPKEKLKNRGIQFNQYLAIVPAYKHEIRAFKHATPSNKERMYNTFMRRSQEEV
uniref:LAM_G_DOMAIN domain-containing protein n=1 Tax=Panagrellus redivivus TaxID=6233 RepID=A0A7E4V3I4_PANRE